MTPKEIDRISRSFLGHIATSRAARDAMAAAKTDTDFADVINDTVVPKDNVRPEDVPAIRQRVAEMFDSASREDPALFRTHFQHPVDPPGGG